MCSKCCLQNGSHFIQSPMFSQPPWLKKCSNITTCTIESEAVGKKKKQKKPPKNMPKAWCIQMFSTCHSSTILHFTITSYRIKRKFLPKSTCPIDCFTCPGGGGGGGSGSGIYILSPVCLISNKSHNIWYNLDELTEVLLSIDWDVDDFQLSRFGVQELASPLSPGGGFGLCGM